MARGIIYVMSTVVTGLVKIGKTSDFEARMKKLETDGYRNVTGLKRQFAIEVDNYDEIEVLLDDLFAKSRVANTELFSLDLNKVIQLLAAFDGKIIYPLTKKEEVFETATEAVETSELPDGTYTISSKDHQRSKTVYNGTMVMNKGVLILKAGSILAPITSNVRDSLVILRNSLNLDNNVLTKDTEISSPSTAANN